MSISPEKASVSKENVSISQEKCHVFTEKASVSTEQASVCAEKASISTGHVCISTEKPPFLRRSYVSVPLISIEDWIELLMSKNEANGGHIGETTLAGHAL